ncbi:MAG: putative bifunctional diguanylate cyclase/phosphodiesterase [Rhizobiaceae bacterium]
MASVATKKNPARTPVFRLITIASVGLCSFLIVLWGLRFSFGDGLVGLSAESIGAMIAALCTLATAGGVISFFAGVDESSEYVFTETQVDRLTGFHSRTAMIGKIAEAAIKAERTKVPIYMIDVDIDRFKQINDAIGYSHGDELIRSFAARLRQLLPESVEIGRIGAGEFAALASANALKDGLDVTVEALLVSLMEPYQISTHAQTLNISAGIISMPNDGTDPIKLLRRSNLALQHARAAGAGNWSAYHDEMGRVAEYRQWIETELNGAVERSDFDLHYQPQLDLATNEVVGYEALIRWRHPDRGMIPPNEFISVAEETGMIIEIGEWVLRKACKDALRLPESCFVAVNISAVQFMTRDFTEMVRGILVETGLAPGRLELEITETAMMQDKARAAKILEEIMALGISVAVDDFGTGYSNLSYLIDFRFNKLKIDRSFVSRLDQDASGTGGAVVSTIVGLSRALGVDTIAEGVETEDQAVLLRAAGCDVVQGFYYGKPEPLTLPSAGVLTSKTAH